MVDADGQVERVVNTFRNRAGTVNGQTRGVAVPGQDVITNITLNEGDDDINNEFGEQCGMSKQDLLASTPDPAAPAAAGVMGIQTYATSPSFADPAAGSTTASAAQILATGADAGGAPTVRVFNFATGTESDNQAYAANFAGGVRVAVGDVNGDGVPDIITAPGAGGGPHIKVFDGATGQLLMQFMAYDPTFAGGVYVAAGDVNGDGKADIITGAGAGGGPHVKVFDGATGQQIASFMAFAPTFAGGVRVAAGDFNGDGKADVVAAAGPGGGPQVSIYNLNAAISSAAANLGVLRSFMAYDVNFHGGVYVTAGDVNGDGRADLVTGAGEGGGPHVQAFDGRSFAVIDSFMAFDPSQSPSGARVAVADVNGDGIDDIVASSGAGAGTFVRVVDAADNSELQFFQAYDPASLSGTFVA
jgi:hypothetical protein